MEGFDQGTILYGIRSERYPSVNCYAIIISASCDIANQKVEKIYYLVGVNAQEWFSTKYAYTQVYNEKLKSLFKKFNNDFKKYSLNAELIQQFSDDEVKLIIEQQDVDVRIKKQLLEIYSDYSVFCKPDMGDIDRLKAIRKDLKPIKNFLKDVTRGRIFHYYLPEDSYLKNGKKDCGLIIDLQEIDSIPLEDISKIKSPGIDQLILSTYEGEERLRLEKKYFLESNDDFVAIEGTIVSPWRELLMQRFSQDFIRIGIDGATEDDFERLIRKI